MVDQPGPIVEVRDLCKTFAVKHAGGVSTLHALSGVNFDIMRGETLGLVGESGSGKTTAGRILVVWRSNCFCRGSHQAGPRNPRSPIDVRTRR